MNQVSLFLLVFSLAVVTMANTFTARVQLITGEKKPVRDCALFMPYLGSETEIVKSNLKKLGYSPQVTEDISVEKTLFMDSNGHSVNEYTTAFKKRVGYYGKGTLLMSMKGYEIGRSKKRIFILKMHRLGMDENEIASSSFIGVMSERQFSLKDLPRCSY